MWPTLFAQEAQELKKVFASDRLISVEHYGSTSVPGLSAKPIIDILVGLNKFNLSTDEIKKFEDLGYEYIGRARTYERFFLLKRSTNSFNLAVVRYAGRVWCDSLAVREYLRAHDNVALMYEQIKLQALKNDCSTVLTYAYYKHDFVLKLVEDARQWMQKNTEI